MKRRSAAFWALATVGLTSAAYPTTAADYGTAPYPNSLNSPQPVPFRIVQVNTPASPSNTNAQPARPGESELRAQFTLLTALAQEHRERADAATKSGQAALAKWESDLADELSHRGSNLQTQLDGFDAQKRALLGVKVVEGIGALSSAELDYLAKVQERTQAVQQELAAATEETGLYALQLATNRNVILSGDNSAALRLQELGRDISRLQAEQADLELKTTHFWALRAMVRNALNFRSAETNQAVPKVSVPAPGQ